MGRAEGRGPPLRDQMTGGGTERERGESGRDTDRGRLREIGWCTDALTVFGRVRTAAEVDIISGEQKPLWAVVMHAVPVVHREAREESIGPISTDICLYMYIEI